MSTQCARAAVNPAKIVVCPPPRRRTKTKRTKTMATTTASTSSAPIYIDTQHEDLVHDAQLDFYGAKLATCSSDRTIKVYNVSEGGQELSATLQGHQGPVWSVAWAHPRFGVLLASGSFDGSVIIWKEVRPREWTIVHHAKNLHESSVNTVAFGPNEYGLQVAAASSDGRVSILTHQKNNTWTVEYLQDSATGVNSVSWAPFGAYYDKNQPELVQPRLVTGGCDNKVRFWSCKDDKWEEDTACSKHSDWVRDVAWAPGLLPNHNVVASCAEDRTVVIWKQQAEANAGSWNTVDWKPSVLHTFEAPVWKVSWSMTGHLLAVSSGDNDVTLWKQGLDDAWIQVGSVGGNAAQQSIQS